jgi:hypothetical protein
MSIETAVVSSDWVSLVSLWEAPTSPPYRDGCSDVLKRAGKWIWQLECIVLVVSCGGMAGAATAGVALTGVLKVLFPQLVPLRM